MIDQDDCGGGGRCGLIERYVIVWARMMTNHILFYLACKQMVIGVNQL